MADWLMIELPWPPTVNNYYTVSRGRKILSSRGRAYKKECSWMLAAEKFPKRKTGKFRIEIICFPPDKRRRDLDNMLKPILDSLTEYGAIPDDSDVDEIRIARVRVEKPGYVRIGVERIEEIAECKK